MIATIFVLSVLLFIGALYSYFSIHKPGFYPPKQLLRKRAKSLFFGGLICLLIGIIFSILL